MAKFNMVAWVGKNWKESTQQPQLVKDAVSATAVIPYLFLPTVLGLNGWSGFALAAGGTWLLGAALGIEGWRRGAVALAATHLCYTVAAGTIEKIMPHPLWRLEGGSLNGLQDAPTMPLQPGASVTTTPDGYQVQTYRQLPEATTIQDGMADYYRGENAAPAQAVSYEDRM